MIEQNVSTLLSIMHRTGDRRMKWSLRWTPSLSAKASLTMVGHLNCLALNMPPCIESRRKFFEE